MVTKDMKKPVACGVMGDYLRFQSEGDCDEYCTALGIDPLRYNVDGYLNGIALKDLNNAATDQRK